MNRINSNFDIDKNAWNKFNKVFLQGGDKEKLERVQCGNIKIIYPLCTGAFPYAC